MVNYLIVRHGETDANVAGRHQCRIDTPLTERGKQQMVKVGKHIRKLQKQGKIDKFDMIYCSATPRTRKSLELVLKYVSLSNPRSITYTTLLWEHNMGSKFDGLTEAEVEQLSPGFSTKRAKDCWNVIPPPNGENYFMVQKRVKEFLRGITGDNILILSHKVVSKMLIGILLKFPRKRFYPISMDCGEWYYIRKGKNIVKVL